MTMSLLPEQAISCRSKSRSHACASWRNSCWSARCVEPHPCSCSRISPTRISRPCRAPRWSELAGKRATGFLNWHRKRHRIHRADVLARVVADLKASAPDHIVVTGDLVNISLTSEYARQASG